MKARIFSVADPVFKTDTLFVLGADFATLDKELRQRGESAGEDMGQIGQMFTFNKFRCVWAASLSLPIVIHEILHLVTRVCDDKGIPIKAHIDSGESNDEPAAYLMEFYVGEVLKRNKKWPHYARTVETLR